MVIVPLARVLRTQGQFVGDVEHRDAALGVVAKFGSAVLEEELVRVHHDVAGAVAGAGERGLDAAVGAAGTAHQEGTVREFSWTALVVQGETSRHRRRVSATFIFSLSVPPM